MFLSRYMIIFMNELRAVLWRIMKGKNILSGKIVFLPLLLLLPLLSFGEDGWSFIKQNDNKKARAAFLETLKTDSVNRDALQGMIYLSELEQDKLSFNKYINTVLRNYKDEHFFSVFSEISDLNAEAIVKQASFSERTKLPSRIRLASDLKEKRQFSASENAYKELFTDMGWSFIGPFRNISGSGHSIAYPVEKDNYDPAGKYKNWKGMELSWVKPKYADAYGKIDMEDYLPGSREGVYYANAFIEVQEESVMQFRIARASPVKIWLDGDLVFEGKDALSFSWDNEVAEMSVPAGVHRVLVKLSTPGGSPKSYDLLSFFDEGDITDFSASSFDFSDIYSFLDGYSSGTETFALRITDKNGNLNKKVKACAAAAYKPMKYNASFTGNASIAYYKEKIAAAPKDLFNYYLLCKASIGAGQAEEAEEFFVKTLRQNKEMVFFKYLAAKLFALNGKIETAYETLNDIQHEKTPVFGLLYEKFQEIDLNNEEEKYLNALNNLRNVTPSNYSVISAYLKYYDKKGLQKEKEDFIKEMKKAYPGYENSLDYELSLTNKPDKEQTDKEREKETKESLRQLKTRFVSYDYTSAISYYKGKDKAGKVLSLYDELISHLPYITSHRKDKARYLYSEGKYEEALKELNEVLLISPYDDSALEQIGDIYGDMDKTKMENQRKAVEYYYRAQRLGGDAGIQDKIDKIEGQKTRKNLFSTKTFDDILKDDGWKGKYQNEESVVLMFTRDLVYDSIATVDIYQQIMIKILNEAGAKKWTEFDFSFLGVLNSVKVIKKSGAEVVPDKRGGYVVFKNLEPEDLIQIDGVFTWKQQTELDQEFSLVHYISFDAPIYYKKYEVAVSSGTYLGHLCHKLSDNVIKTKRSGYDFYTWEYHDIPKIENEDAVPDAYDMYGSIMISTMPDWSKVVNWFQQVTYRKLEPGYEIREALDSIIRPGMSREQQVTAIYNYITKKIKYSYVSFLQSGYVPKDAGITLASGIGDCKDVATIMICMLRQLGIESHYALVKTNQFNHQAMLPSLYFDHVVVMCTIDGKQKFFDLTTDFYPHYVLTENDINAYALIIKDGEKELIRLPDDGLDPEKNKVVYNITASLETDLSLKIKAAGVYPGIAGGSLREVISAITESEKKNYIIDNVLGKGTLQNLNLVDHKLENPMNISEPLRADYTVTVPDFSDEVANLLICKVPYLTAIQPSPAISSKTRHNRLNLDGLGKTDPTLQKIEILIPKGYKVLQLPKDEEVVSKYGTYKLSFRKTATGIYVEKYQSFSSRIIEESEFAAFKAFYQKLLKLDNTKIALQKG